MLYLWYCVNNIYLKISLIINEIIIALCLKKYQNQVTASSKFTEFRKSCGGHSIDDTPAAPLLAKKSATSFPMIPICAGHQMRYIGLYNAILRKLVAIALALYYPTHSH